MNLICMLVLLLLFHFTRGKGIVSLIRNGKEYEINSKVCNSGTFLAVPRTFNCACISGLWLFYTKFCATPVLVIGGDQYCFRADNMTVAQIAIAGNFRYPFAPSISHFLDNYVMLTQPFTEDEELATADVSGSWITITDTKWTLYGDGGESICLIPLGSGNRIFCLFNDRLDAALDKGDWNLIVRVKKGCHSNKTAIADNCFKINSPNDRSHCGEYPRLDPVDERHECDNSDEDDDVHCLTSRSSKSKHSGWIPLYPPLKSPKEIALASTNYSGDSINSIRSINSIDDKHIIPPQSTNGTNNTIPSSDSVENWIPFPFTPRKNETYIKPEVKCDELTREDVKKYWYDMVNNECAKSINEAVFTDQLRRFAVTRLDNIFDSRLHSLEQMEQILFHSRDIIKKTCGTQYVPFEFFNVAADAFRMFLGEDFFYGVEGIDSVSYDRILKSLAKCSKRAKLFVFETQPLGCDLKKINGTLILPGEKINISIPEAGKSKHFEPLIETVWKMFLNAHSYCFEDFLFINDHHHFSVLFLELFSRTIYEKWIEPLRNKELYKFIVPHFQVMKQIMENLDYCVAATNQVSKCHVWLMRSSPLAKSVVGGKGTNTIRKKRSIWEARINENRNATRLWEGLPNMHCLQTMEEPTFGLGYFDKCNQVF